MTKLATERWKVTQANIVQYIYMVYACKNIDTEKQSKEVVVYQFRST